MAIKKEAVKAAASVASSDGIQNNIATVAGMLFRIQDYSLIVKGDTVQLRTK